jgi:hypothetical protein
MDLLPAAEAVAGGALLFVVPGFAVAKAIFPERRVRGPDGVRWAIELAALALVASVALTVLVGYLLLQGSSGGFSASWREPLLEEGLASVAVVAFVVGWLEGAYARTPTARAAASLEPAGADAWELSEKLDRLQRERQGLERELRRSSAEDAGASARLRERIELLLAQERELRQRREAGYER